MKVQVGIKDQVIVVLSIVIDPEVECDRVEIASLLLEKVSNRTRKYKIASSEFAANTFALKFKIPNQSGSQTAMTWGTVVAQEFIRKANDVLLRLELSAVLSVTVEFKTTVKIN